jgi:Cu/Zn superoxide dismutase
MRSTRSTLLLASALALPLAAAALAAPASAGTPRVGDFSVDLAKVNSDGTGHVDLSEHGTQLMVHLTVNGVDGGVHLAHIHGIKQAMNECPSLAADADGNGLIDFAEGLPSYGPVQVTLSNGTNDRGTSLDWTRRFTHLDNGDGIASLGPLDQYAIVVHGVDLNGDGVATNPDADGNGAPDPAGNEISMPALCGVIHADH